MFSLRCLAVIVVSIAFSPSGNARLLWRADFESYDASGTPPAVITDGSGDDDTFTGLSNSGTTGVVFSAQVAPSTLAGNALKLSFTNTSTSSKSAIYLQVLQSALSVANGSGVFGNGLVLSYDVTKSTSSSANSRSYGAAPSGTVGNNNTTTGAIVSTTLRYTFVINQTGAPLVLPGSLGTLPTNSAISYYFDGTTFSGASVPTAVSNTDIAGFSTGVYRGNSLSAGTTVTVWCDNMGLWNAVSDMVGGVSVLALPPGGSVPPTPPDVPAGLVWTADFESYDTTGGPAAPILNASGDVDTLSETSYSSRTGLVFAAEVAPSSLTGNALKLTLNNTSSRGLTATYMMAGQAHQPSLGSDGIYILSYDAVRTGSNGISGSRGYAATTSGTTGNNNTTSTGFGSAPLRYTFVINRSGSAVSLPGSLGTVGPSATAGYYFDGTIYSGLTTVSSGAASTAITGFSTGVYRSNSLASGASVTVWLDNMSLWNSPSATVAGANVLSLPPGTLTTNGAKVWHVDANSGSDTDDGLSAPQAFATIQHAVNQTRPGDTVLVHPGIYYENVLVKQGGTAEQPIRIMADEVAKDRVIVTGAVRAVRDQSTTWQLAASSTDTYYISLSHRPTRVLADRADLLPYPTLADLNAFSFTADNNYIGTKHGFAWDGATNRLYVRLRADGKFGPTNPNLATMAVSPPTGGGSLGVTPNGPGDFLFKMQMTGAAHVIIDGFTFETPGIAAVYTAGSDLVVRNSWFYGCRNGVNGASGTVDRVTVEQCYFTHYPAYTDALDVIHEGGLAQKSKPASWEKIVHWQRKGGYQPVSGGVGMAYSYESGIARSLGDDWVIRRNHFHEVFEALPSGATSNSHGAQIYENRFEGVCDNAVETESHAHEITIHDNLLIDVFEPFSWQPQDGIPLPGPVYIFDNTVRQTGDTSAAWAIVGYDPGIFKLGIASDTMWDEGQMGSLPRTEAEAPGGFWVSHNTVSVARGRVFTALNPTSRSYKGFVFLNNLLVTRLSTSRTQTGMILDYNFIAPFATPTSGELTNFESFAGTHGLVYPSPADLDLEVLPNGALEPGSGCLATGQGTTSHTLSLSGGGSLTIPATVPLRADPGAVPFSATAGPQPR